MCCWRVFCTADIAANLAMEQMEQEEQGSQVGSIPSPPRRDARERELLAAYEHIGGANEVLNERAVAVMKRMSDKLTGRDFLQEVGLKLFIFYSCLHTTERIGSSILMQILSFALALVLPTWSLCNFLSSQAAKATGERVTLELSTQAAKATSVCVTHWNLAVRQSSSWDRFTICH